MKLIKKIKLIIYDSRKLQTQKNTRRLHWKHVADEFNSSKNVLEMKSGHICKERWKNCLQRKYEKYSKLQLIYIIIFFLRAHWTQQEDLLILQYVLENGSKWSKITHLLKNRTEHCIKNRFFGILSKFVTLTQRKIKKEFNYLESNFLRSMISQYNSLSCEHKSEKKETEADVLNVSNNSNSLEHELNTQGAEFISKGIRSKEEEEKMYAMLNLD